MKELTSYWTVEMPAMYWVDLVLENAAWVPIKAIPMPHHHATSLHLENLAEFSEKLANNTTARFIVEITRRDIQAVPNQHQWFTTYYARIIDTCTG